MHIHIHNEPGGVDHPITPAQWKEAEIAEHRVTFGKSAADFKAQSATVEILISPPWEIRRLDLRAARKLKIIQSTSAGVDSLAPLEETIPDTVLLLNNRGTHGEKAGEYVAMAILMLVNHMPVFFGNQRAQIWARQTAGLARRQRLTIVGLGSLGTAAAFQARRLGLHVTGVRHSALPHPQCHRTITLSGLEEALPDTDILLLACPLTPETSGLLSAGRIALLPQGAGVINIGRGRLADQDALFDALDDGRLGGAVLDVFEKEPLRPGDRAWHVKNLIITPHMSSDDPLTYNSRTLAIFKTNLDAYLAGNMPPTAVDRVKGY